MIYGVTDEIQLAAFPEAGQLRKGAKKPDRGPGQDLKHFRFTSKVPGVEAAFLRAYGPTPASIDVMFPYERLLENFDAWGEAWRTGSLDHRCNGKTCVLWQENGKFYTPETYAATKGTSEPFHKPCPGGCKWTGRLKVFLPRPEYAEVAGLSQVTVMTTAKNDVLNIYRELRAITDKRGADNLMGIPCVISRAPHMISTPPRQGSSERQRIEKWLIHVAMKAEYGAALLEKLAAQADPRRLLAERQLLLLAQAQIPLALPAPGDELEDDTADDEDDQATEAAIAAEDARHAATGRTGALVKRLEALWAREVKAGKTNPPAERALDIAGMDYTELVQLGVRVSSRVTRLEAGDTETWARDWRRDGDLAEPVSVVVASDAAAQALAV